MPSIPEKLLRLHTGENALCKKSLEEIEKDDDLIRHVSVIDEAMNILNYFSTNEKENEDDDSKTIRLLGMRLFNGCGAAFRMTISGYYQNAAMIMRDFLETVFLLGYLSMDRTKINEWREADDRTRKQAFKPVKVRTALDERDGFSEKKRAAAYELLCELASHPTYQGFRMLAPKGHDHHCGPFLDPSALKAMIEELVKLAIQAGQNHSQFFDTKTIEGMETRINFLQATGEWFERYFERPFDHGAIAKLRAELEELRT